MHDKNKADTENQSAATAGGQREGGRKEAPATQNDPRCRALPRRVGKGLRPAGKLGALLSDHAYAYAAIAIVAHTNPLTIDVAGIGMFAVQHESHVGSRLR